MILWSLSVQFAVSNVISLYNDEPLFFSLCSFFGLKGSDMGKSLGKHEWGRRRIVISRGTDVFHGHQHPLFATIYLWSQLLVHWNSSMKHRSAFGLLFLVVSIKMGHAIWRCLLAWGNLIYKYVKPQLWMCFHLPGVFSSLWMSWAALQADSWKWLSSRSTAG